MLQSALMLMMEFSKMYCTWQTIQTLSLVQKIPVLETVRDISFLSTIPQLYCEISLSRKLFRIGHVQFFAENDQYYDVPE